VAIPPLLGMDGAWAVPRRYAPATLPLENAWPAG
jgi:hypothetical protein